MIVTKAEIQVIKPDKLEVGDEILYYNIRCTVMNIKGGESEFAEIKHTTSAGEERIYKIRKFPNFYKILKAEEQ